MLSTSTWEAFQDAALRFWREHGRPPVALVSPELDAKLHAEREEHPYDLLLAVTRVDPRMTGMSYDFTQIGDCGARHARTVGDPSAWEWVKLRKARAA